MSEHWDEVKIRDEVVELLGADTSGHGMDHVDHVYASSVQFCESEMWYGSTVDMDVVRLTALLHDVDDYKLFGTESAEQLTNARAILDRHEIEPRLAQHVLSIIPTMGYNNYLEGKRPETIEGQLVSDADMCDAIGARGLIRVFEYNKSKGRAFFDPSIPPYYGVASAENYRASGNEHAVQHFFDKLLRIPDILMTDAGQQEGRRRAAVMVTFLENLFIEEDAEEWQEYLHLFRARKHSQS